MENERKRLKFRGAREKYRSPSVSTLRARSIDRSPLPRRAIHPSISRAIAPRQFTPSFRMVEPGSVWMREGKKRLRDFFFVQKPHRICHTLSSFSLPRFPLSSFPISHSHRRPFRMESSPPPLPLIERAKSCGFSTRWTSQMANASS